MAEKEYIEREAAIKEFSNNGSIFVYGKQQCKAIVSRLNVIPAADVRPVVLCRDCKYGQGAKMDFWNEYEGIECIGGVVHRKDWFCADGEKEEQE